MRLLLGLQLVEAVAELGALRLVVVSWLYDQREFCLRGFRSFIPVGLASC